MPVSDAPPLVDTEFLSTPSLDSALAEELHREQPTGICLLAGIYGTKSTTSKNSKHSEIILANGPSFTHFELAEVHEQGRCHEWLPVASQQSFQHGIANRVEEV